MSTCRACHADVGDASGGGHDTGGGHDADGDADGGGGGVWHGPSASATVPLTISISVIVLVGWVQLAARHAPTIVGDSGCRWRARSSSSIVARPRAARSPRCSSGRSRRSSRDQGGQVERRLRRARLHRHDRTPGRRHNVGQASRTSRTAARSCSDHRCAAITPTSLVTARRQGPHHRLRSRARSGRSSSSPSVET